ncbi:hypothetical protein M758_2G172500 [Ceratodon purpureus]|nr:hypothetical protein M758_2G172500 [Ceratodon purpureus]
MDNNLTLLLEALAGNGCVLPSEHRAALDISLKVKKQDAGLQTLALWGRIFTATGNDYILAEGYVSAKRIGRKLVFDTKYYYTQDGVLWLDLQPPENDDRYALCKSAKGPFTGDPATVQLVVPDPIEPSEYDEFVEPALEGDKSGSSATDEKTGSEDEEKEATTETEGEEGEDTEEAPGEPEEAKVIEDEEVAEGEGGEGEGEGEEIPAGIELPELERLCGLMKWIDEECGVVPLNSLVLTPNDVLIKNSAFTAGYLFAGYMTAPLSKDLPGSWGIYSVPLQNDVVVRSLAWPGYFSYYSATSHDWGSVYFGFGEKNKDIAFGVP